jgi:hypothetical protein
MSTRLALALLLLLVASANAAAQPARSLVVEDIFGRSLNKHGIVLVDWEGHLANPALEFYLIPPADAELPAQAVLQADEPRLYFDLPSQTGPKGPRKQLAFTKREKLPFRLSIFPDRDGKDEQHRLEITFTDTAGHMAKLAVPIHVIDQDRDRPDDFTITIDFSQDKTEFFKDEKRRAVVEQAARDWAYFFDGTDLKPVAAGAERTLIWGPDGFRTRGRVTNTREYRGYLLYAYGIKSDLLRSGGEPSPFGGFQQRGPTELKVRRSGGIEVEVQGNYNTRGWLVSMADGDWWRATNLGDVENDLYSIVHHEIGHALAFNPGHRRVERGAKIDDKALRAYLGRAPVVSRADHLEGVVDPESLRGAFGNEYHGRVPHGRWLITKLDLLWAQAVGYRLRETSAFRPLELATADLPRATLAKPYTAALKAIGGIPFYHWDVTAGALPTGLSLDAFTGTLRGTPKASGEFDFEMRVRDYTSGSHGQTRRLRLVVAGKDR